MKHVLIAAALLASSAALAQTNAPPAPNGPQGQQHEQPFEEIKARHLQHIAQRIAQLQKAQTCVQAAANPEALHACRPQHPQQQ